MFPGQGHEPKGLGIGDRKLGEKDKRQKLGGIVFTEHPLYFRHAADCFYLYKDVSSSLHSKRLVLLFSLNKGGN